MKKSFIPPAKIWFQDDMADRLSERARKNTEAYEDSKPDKVALEKNMPGKTILRNKEAVGASIHGRWCWKPAGLARYSEDERKHAEKWASTE